MQNSDRILVACLFAACIACQSRATQPLGDATVGNALDLEVESIGTTSIPAQQANSPDVVYRFVPAVADGRVVQRVAPVAKDELAPRSVYYKFSPRSGRHVWSVLADDGQFYFAIGQGSTLRTDLFDIRLTAEQLDEILETVAPRLKQKLEDPNAANSINVYLRLGTDGQWELLPNSLTEKVQSIYDLETGQRWEWHGSRRRAVLHSTGDMWQVVDGRYIPVTTYAAGWSQGCRRPRAGSINQVLRTSPTGL